MDNLPGTAGNDTFTGGKAEIQAADTINGQGGDDTAKLFLDTGNGTLQSSNVETFEIQSTNAGGATFTANNVTGMTKIINERSATDLTVTSLQNMVDLEINSPTGAANASDTFLVFSSGVLGGTDKTLNVKVNNQTALQELEVDTAGGDTITTMNLESTGGKNILDLGSTTAGDFELKTLNVSGDTRMTLTDAGGNTPLSDVTTVNASAMTAGGLRVDLSNKTKGVTFTGGAGDDRVIFAAGQLDSNDVIDMGDGTKDAIIAGEGVFNATGANWVTAINNAKNVEIAGSSDAAGAAGAAGNAGSAAVTVDMSVFSSIKSFETTAAAVGGAGTSASAANSAGQAGGEAILGTFTVNNTLYIDNDLSGGVGSAGVATNAAGGAGGDAIAANMKTDTGSDVLNLIFQEDNVTNVTGGAGGAKAGSGADGAGGLALDANQIETINITTTSAKDDVTFRAGVDGAAAATTTGDVRVGTNGKVDIAGAGDVDLGVLISSAANPNNNLTVDGTDMSGKLTVTLAGTNDAAIAGSGGSAITLTDLNDGGTNQVHSITFGSGTDQLNLVAWAAAGDSTGTKATASTLTSFTSGTDKVAWNGPGTATFVANKVDVSGAANLAGAIDLAAASTTAATNGVVRYFNWSGDSYVVFDASNTGTFVNATDSVIKFAGVTDLVAGDFVLS